MRMRCENIMPSPYGFHRLCCATRIMNAQRRQAPAIVRLFNSAARSVRLPRPGFELDEVCRSASWATGLSDFGHPAFLSRLEALCRSVASQRALTYTGSLSQRVFFQWHLTNRLREVQLLKEHPEILEIPVPAPIIVVGGYRTGSTHLHTLLAQDPQFRAPLMWELAFQVQQGHEPEADQKRRRHITNGILSLNRLLIPDQKHVHEVLTDGPEECHFLLENAALSMTQYISFLGHDYAYWLLKQDVSDAYASLRRQYQILTWLEQQAQPQRPLHPWLLKCPLHTWYLGELMKAFPDARLLWTHRPMSSTLPSTCGLTAVTATKFFHHFDAAKVGSFWLDYYEKGFARGLKVRDANPSFPLLDVSLQEVSRRPEETLEKIYGYLGLERSVAAQEAARFYLSQAEEKRGRQVNHKYTLAEFGLNQAQVNARFADYHARFSLI